MSAPEHPHRLRQEQEKGAGGDYVAARYAQMHCDSTVILGCPLAPIRAPRLIVPPKPFDFTLPPRRCFTTLHYCERHKKECTVELLLKSGDIKADIERVAKAKWPHGTVPDFDHASIEWMLTTTPEYRAFLIMIEQGMRADIWSGGRLL